MIKKHKSKHEVLNLRKYVAKAKLFDIMSGGKIVLLNKNEAEANDIKPGFRIALFNGTKRLIASVDTSNNLVKKGQVGLFVEAREDLGAREGTSIRIEHIQRPKSIQYIKKKMDGKALEKKEINEIITDMMHNQLTQAEMAILISSMYIRGLSDNEVVGLTNAIVNSGDILDLGKRAPIADKHCVGGVNGRTTMLVVPIMAAAGVYMPKTSSRAITSAAGTADCMEILAPVDIKIDELKRIVVKHKGAIIWGGGVNIAAADDKLIKIRNPLRLDPRGVLLSSILAKKKCVGAKHVIIDLPVGRGAKFDSIVSSKGLAEDFIGIGKKLGMNLEVFITDGSDPIGNTIGPSLECMSVLDVLNNNGPIDLRNKSCQLAGRLLEMSGKVKAGHGFNSALKLIENGKALRKFRDIIGAQGGNSKVKNDDLPIGHYTYEHLSDNAGRISHVDNKMLSRVARASGAPLDRGAGIILNCERGDKVSKNDVLFTIYAEHESKLDFAIKTLEQWDPIEMQSMIIRAIK